MTKIMTVILGIENFDDLDEKITLTNEMFSGLYEQDATQAGFQPGEEVRVIDLLYGAMLPSGAGVLYCAGRYDQWFRGGFCGADE